MKNHINQGKDIMETADEFAEEAKQAGEDVWKSGEMVAKNAEKAANQRWESVVSAARKQTKASQSAISKSPLQAIAIALGAGLILGRLFSSRR